MMTTACGLPTLLLFLFFPTLSFFFLLSSFFNLLPRSFYTTHNHLIFFLSLPIPSIASPRSSQLAGCADQHHICPLSPSQVPELEMRRSTIQSGVALNFDFVYDLNCAAWLPFPSSLSLFLLCPPKALVPYESASGHQAVGILRQISG
ncbi:hypothetical protein BDV28DRAFT_128423, partial [Aspergillus coremiiformis]